MVNRDSHKLTGFILKKRTSRDNDQLITFFSREKGKLTFVAKGAQKVSGRRIGSLDSLNMVHVQLSQHHGFYYLKSIDLITRLEELKKDFEKRTSLLLIAEVLEKLLPVEEVEEEAFDFFKQLLITLHKGPFTSENSAEHICELVRILGYTPPPSKANFSLTTFVQSITEREVISFKLN